MSPLLAVARERRELFVRNSPRAYPFAEALVRYSYSLRFDDLLGMIDAGRLATEVADRLSARQTRRAEGEVCDLRAHAWAMLGNALRSKGHLASAGQALLTAEKLLSAGTGKRRDLTALWLEFSASLCMSQRGYEEAQDLLARAHQIRAALEDPQGAGKVRIQQASAVGCAGDPERAVRILYEALHLVQDDPDLARAGLHNLICHLIAANRADRARTVLARVRGLLKEGGSLFQLQLRWLDARLAAADGSWHPVLLWRRYHGIHAAFACQGRLREAKGVTLDLDVLHKATACSTSEPVPDEMRPAASPRATLSVLQRH